MRRTIIDQSARSSSGRADGSALAASGERADGGATRRAPTDNRRRVPE